MSLENKTNTSALVIIPPKSSWASIQRIRRAYDKSFARWPPHINLLYPFLPVENFDTVHEIIEKKLSDFMPFKIKLDVLGYFDHQASSTIFADVNSHEVMELQAMLEKCFIQCDDLRKRGGATGYHPHLTLGSVKKRDREKFKADIKEMFQPFEFIVDQVYFLSREGESPFEIKASVSLRKNVGLPELSSSGNITQFDEHSIYHFNVVENRWTSFEWSSNIKTPISTSLTVLTYNVLFDHDLDNRLSLLTEVLLSSNADIIGIQEATSLFLEYILCETWVRECYYISHGPSSTLPSKGSQIILSKYPFRYYTHIFSEFKVVLLAELLLFGRRLLIPVMHLTSNFRKDMHQKRAEQMMFIYSQMDAIDSKDVIILLDSNTADEDIPSVNEIFRSDYVDAWMFVHRSAEGGATFDPLNNTVASLTAIKKDSARRYDRVLVCSDVWKVKEAELVGVEPVVVQMEEGEKKLFASDHYGLRCVLNFCEEQTSVMDTNVPSPSATVPGIFQHTSDETIEMLLHAEGVFETEEGNQQRERALNTLSTCISKLLNGRFELKPIGSYQLGVHSPDSDIDCIAYGNFSRHDFFGLFKGRKKVTSITPGIKVKRVLEDAIVPVVKLQIFNVKIDLQHCFVPAYSDSNFNIDHLDDATLSNMPVKVRAMLNSYLDGQYLLASLPEKRRFILAYHAIKLWARRHGLYSNRLGLMGGYALSILIARICKTHLDANVSGLISAFFSTYSNWNWKSDAVSLTDIEGPDKAFKMTKKDAIMVISVHRPRVNITRNSTISTRRVWIEELSRAYMAESIKQLWVYCDIRSKYASFIQIILGAIEISEYISLVNYVESRIVMLLVSLDSSCPDLMIRPWPRRFLSSTCGFPNEGSYVLGIQRVGDNTGTSGTFNGALRSFEEAMLAWEGLTANMLVSVRHVSAAKVASEYDKSLDSDVDIEA